MRFGKDITQVIKGIAIILMMMLHCFRVDGNYDVVVDVSHAPFVAFSDTFKICVGIFAFMVGYGYAFSKTKDYRYAWQHIKKLLIPFWTILFVFTLPLCFKEFRASGWQVMLYNMVGINSTFNYYSWFVYFYIFCMLVMPPISRFIDRRPIVNGIIVIAVDIALLVAVHSIDGVLDEGTMLYALFNCLLISPTMYVGYVFARERLYERIDISRFHWSVVLIVVMLLTVMVLTVRFYTIAKMNLPLDVVYAPLFIGGVVILFNRFKLRAGRRILQELGKVSVYMWFFHALFFTKAVRWFYQPTITIFDDLNLIVLWAIALTFAASWLINTAVDFVISKATKTTN